eukprot:scaffold7707_cov72-Cylindrotheca_fusiformis.AAC.3
MSPTSHQKGVIRGLRVRCFWEESRVSFRTSTLVVLSKGCDDSQARKQYMHEGTLIGHGFPMFLVGSFFFVGCRADGGAVGSEGLSFENHTKALTVLDAWTENQKDDKRSIHLRI